LIINALNKCRLEFCKPLKYEYTLLDKNEYALTNLNNDTFTNLGYPSIKSEQKQYVKFNFLILDFIIEEYIFISDKTIEITFSWKGEIKTLIQIYSTIVSSISIPQFVFAFCDILYKFSIAEIFDFTAVAMQDKNIYYSERIHIIQNGTLGNIFPDTFKEFIDEYHDQLNLLKDNKNKNHQKHNIFRIPSKNIILMNKFNELIPKLGIKILNELYEYKWNIQYLQRRIKYIKKN